MHSKRIPFRDHCCPEISFITSSSKTHSRSKIKDQTAYGIWLRGVNPPCNYWSLGRIPACVQRSRSNAEFTISSIPRDRQSASEASKKQGVDIKSGRRPEPLSRGFRSRICSACIQLASNLRPVCACSTDSTLPALC